MWLVAGTRGAGRPWLIAGLPGLVGFADRGPRVVGARAGSRQAAQPAPGTQTLQVGRRAGRGQAAARPLSSSYARQRPAARRDRRVAAALHARTRATRRRSTRATTEKLRHHRWHERAASGTSSAPEARGTGSGSSCADRQFSGPAATSRRGDLRPGAEHPLPGPAAHRQPLGMRTARRRPGRSRAGLGIRIKLRRPSHVMGLGRGGIGDDLLADPSRRKRSTRRLRSASAVRYEVLNFGGAGYRRSRSRDAGRP